MNFGLCDKMEIVGHMVWRSQTGAGFDLAGMGYKHDAPTELQIPVDGAVEEGLGLFCSGVSAGGAACL